MQDPKDVYNDRYAEAIEDGCSEARAHKIAEEERVDAEAALIDDAMNRLREDPELHAEIEAKVAKLDMGGRVS